MALTLFVACVGSALTAQLGAARLLYGMGRDSVLPKRAFGSLNRHGTPALADSIFARRRQEMAVVEITNGAEVGRCVHVG